ncbi:hypothetical protein YWY31_03220 [Paenibacillus illinoisensis]
MSLHKIINFPVVGGLILRNIIRKRRAESAKEVVEAGEEHVDIEE